MGLVELVELEIAQRARAERAEVTLMHRARIVYRRVGVAGEIDYLRVVYKNIRYLVLAPVDAAVDSICNVRVLEEEYRLFTVPLCRFFKLRGDEPALFFVEVAAARRCDGDEIKAVYHRMGVGSKTEYLIEAAQGILLAVGHIFVARHGHYQPDIGGQTCVENLLDLAHLNLRPARSEVADDDERVKAAVSLIGRAQIFEVVKRFCKPLFLDAVLVVDMYVAHDCKAQRGNKVFIKRHYFSLFHQSILSNASSQ